MIDERLLRGIRGEVAAMAHHEAREDLLTGQQRSAPDVESLKEPTGAVTIMVGVDGSEASEKAVVWAAAEAARRNARLVLAWVEEPHADLPPTAEEEQGAQRHLAGLARSVKEVHEQLDVVADVVGGVAGPTLVERARTADLLVVGASGRGVIARTLLGSVSTYCATHATCPTTIVPRSWRPPSG